MLGQLLPCDTGRHCLVLDLDETLVHSSFKWVPNADYILPVEIDGSVHNVYVIKRPGCDEFLRRTGELYEVVVFTASLAKYADPLLDMLDIHNVIRARLFREACVYHEGTFVKDLSLLGRDPNSTIIIDNSPASYLFQPENALPCESFIDDMADRELWQLLEFLEHIARCVDVREALFQWVNGTWIGPQGIQLMPDSEEEEDAAGTSLAVPQLMATESPGVSEGPGSSGRASITGVVTSFTSDVTSSGASRDVTQGSGSFVAVDAVDVADTATPARTASSSTSSQARAASSVITSSATTTPAHTSAHEELDAATRTPLRAHGGGEGASAMPADLPRTPVRNVDPDATRTPPSHHGGRQSTSSSTAVQVGGVMRDSTDHTDTPDVDQPRALGQGAAGPATFNISVQVSVTAANGGNKTSTPTSSASPSTPGAAPTIMSTTGSSVIVTPSGGTVTNSSKRYSSALPAAVLPAQVISITTAVSPPAGGARTDEYFAQKHAEVDDAAAAAARKPGATALVDDPE